MELVEGPTLAERLREGPLPEAEAVRLGIQLADGLAAAHAEGVVHCDLKPANLKLPPGGDLRILDFGIAKLRRAPEADAESVLETLTSTAREVAGTLPYMAPGAAPRGARRRPDGRLGRGRRPLRDGDREAAVRRARRGAPHGRDPPRGAGSSLRGRVRAVDRPSRVLRTVFRRTRTIATRAAAQLRTDLETPADRRPRSSIRGSARRRRAARPPRSRRAPASALAAVLALLLAADVGGVRTPLVGGRRARRIDSLAVLPLSNLSKDPEQEYFADGMTEAVIAELSRLKALKVISRTSAMKYKNAKETLPEIAKALGVKGVVEGSVLRDGKTVRITVQLIDAATDRHLWAESYTREDRNVLALQSEVASAIAREVRVAVSPEEAGRFVAARPWTPRRTGSSSSGRTR